MNNPVASQDSKPIEFDGDGNQPEISVRTVHAFAPVSATATVCVVCLPPACPKCDSREWRDLGEFHKHRPFRVEREFQCETCGHRRQQELVRAAHPPRPGKPSNSPRECRSGKFRYEDKKAATGSVNKRMASPHNRPAMLRAYPCRLCRGWHITHQPLKSE